VFVGYDPREHEVDEVCRRSLVRRPSIPLDVWPIRATAARWSSSTTTSSTSRTWPTSSPPSAALPWPASSTSTNPSWPPGWTMPSRRYIRARTGPPWCSTTATTPRTWQTAGYVLGFVSTQRSLRIRRASLVVFNLVIMVLFVLLMKSQLDEQRMSSSSDLEQQVAAASAV
jgi:hypothetical protein